MTLYERRLLTILFIFFIVLSLANHYLRSKNEVHLTVTPAASADIKS